MSDTLLITGANGFIGSRLATLAIARGYRVRTLTRADWSGAPAVPVEERFFGSFPNRIPSQALEGVSVVVHCAAVLEANDRWAEAVNVRGTVRLAELAAQQGVGAFVFLSTQSAQPEAVSSYGRSKYMAEQALRSVAGIHAVILRPGLVCGSGSRGLYQRMCRLVEKLPVIPLLGGGRAIVQPIHVDDLCEAVFQSAGRAAELNGQVLCLGDPQGLSLAEFLRRLSIQRLGRPKMSLHVPLWPIELAVGVAERLRIPLPINSNNLKGLKAVTKMQTAADFARLGLKPRSVDEILRETPQESAEEIPLSRRAVRMILIGGGRIGLVHAMTLNRLRGADFVGVVDTKPAALGLLRGLGLGTKGYSSLETVLQERKPDAAVIATPASSHLPLARACLSRGLGVMVEKPLALKPDDLAGFRRLAQEFPDLPIGVGYVLLRNPQVDTMIRRLRAGEFGKVRHFLGLTLHAYIFQPDPKRWEVKKEISGGGVLINSGGHVLSMIHAAFGPPRQIEAQTISPQGAEVEDSMMIRFAYEGFEGVQCASWSIRGFQRQENRLVVWTERGRLVLTASAAVYLPLEGRAEVCHQLDFDPGFNLAPDYAGAGFTQELNDLRDAVRTGSRPPVGLAEAIQIEELLFQAYAVAQPVQKFSLPLPAVGHSEPAAVLESQKTNHPSRILDLRELTEQTIVESLTEHGVAARWDGFEVTAHQARALPASWQQGEKLRITVPDFLQQSRLLVGGHYGQVLREMGAVGVLRAGLAATPMVLRARGVSFWAAAMGLLAADLEAVPSGFRGSLLLYGYLTDIALGLNQPNLLDRMLELCRRMRPSARIGFHTNLATEAEAAMPLLSVAVDEISLLASPRGLGLDNCVASLRAQAASGARITAEVGPAPGLLHKLAGRDLRIWSHGADAVLVGPAADDYLAERLRKEKEQAWQAAFPGVELPEAAL